MYNGHEFLSCIKISAAKQATAKKSEKIELMDFAADHRDLISVANKVFGEGKWNHSVVHQTLDYVEIIGAKCSVGCVSSVKVQLENGTFHEDIGYYSTEESTKGLSIHNARMGSAINGLRRALLSFGDKIERELQSQKQVEQTQKDDIQKNTIQSLTKQIEEKSNVSAQEPVMIEDENLVLNEKKVSIAKDKTNTNPSLPSSSNLITSEEFGQMFYERVMEDPDFMKQVYSGKIDGILLKDKTILKLPEKDIQRIERKRKQMLKQMEFKKRMMEKEKITSSNDNKPNPKY